MEKKQKRFYQKGYHHASSQVTANISFYVQPGLEEANQAGYLIINLFSVRNLNPYLFTFLMLQ